LKKLIIVALFFSKSLFASPLTLKTSNEYLDLLKIEENLPTMMDTLMTPMLEGMSRGLQKNFVNRGMPIEKAQLGIEAAHPYFIDTKNAVLAQLDQAMPFEKLRTEVYHPIFSESFSEEELSELIEFLSTPLGQKYIEQSVPIMQKSSLLTQQKFGPALEALYYNEFEIRKEAMKESILKAFQETP
jgi:hypothetical protein